MSVEGAASRLGLTEYELRELVSGTAHSGVAERLEVSIKDMDDFFDGYVSPGMAEALDMPHSSAQSLRDIMDAAGAVGIIVGMCVYKPPAS
ncbi:MAG TPA: hypothetical protein VFR69_10695 [Rubrobacteraceae bacterium]|nr:hypothetical protein [Rubrobacteraceae bacterium]